MDEAYANTAHLFRRAGFGALHAEIEANKGRPWPELVDLVLDTSRAPLPLPSPICPTTGVGTSAGST